MKRLDLLAFGEILWDLFQDRQGRFLPRLGGAPANVAVQLARMGLKAGVLGGVGRDFLGGSLRDEVVDSGAIAEALVEKRERTGVVFIRRDQDGEPHFLFYRQKSADMMIDARDVSAVLARVGRPPRVVHVSTSTLSLPSLARATRTLLRGTRGAFVVCDLNVRLRMWRGRRELLRAGEELVAGAGLIKASEADLRAMGFSSTERGLAWLARRTEGLVLLTQGGGEALILQGREVLARAVTKPLRVVDATGAGDGFLAGFLAVLLLRNAIRGDAITASTETFVRALRFGHLVGGRVVRRIGAVEGTRDVSRLRRDFQKAHGSRKSKP